MKDHDRVHTSLKNHVQSGRGPDDDRKTCGLRLEAYRQQRIVMIKLDDVLGWDIRAIIENEAKRQMGI